MTASKLFVKSATESERQMLDCLSHCVGMLERVGGMAADCAEAAPPVAAGTKEDDDQVGEGKLFY